MGFENTDARHPDLKKSFCFAPGVPVFFTKRSFCLVRSRLGLAGNFMALG
jgi:hypothetical protein